jgi:hypothetical protein
VPELSRPADAFKKAKLPVQIFAIHDKAAKSLDEVAEKTAWTKQRLWAGRNLPFPILLDADDVTAQRYGIQGRPTTLLIDPSGKLIGSFHGAKELLAHLPKLDDDIAVEASLASTHNFGFSGSVPPLNQLQWFSDITGLKFPVSKEAREIVSRPVPYECGPGPSLRTWLISVLEPLGLTFEQKGLDIEIVRAIKPHVPFPEEKYAEARIRRVLAKSGNFDFEGDLSELASKVSDWTEMENLVLDPKSQIDGKLDPKSRVSIRSSGQPLGKALAQALKPLGLQVAIRHEAIYLVAQSASQG